MIEGLNFFHSDTGYHPSLRYYENISDRDFNTEEKNSRQERLRRPSIKNCEPAKNTYTDRVTRYLEQTKPAFSAKYLIAKPPLRTFIPVVLAGFAFVITWPFAIVTSVGLLYLLLGAMIMGFRGIIFLIGLVEKDTARDAVLTCKNNVFTDRNTENKIITILIPLYKEHNMVSQIARAIEALEYPQSRLDVKILLEEDDIETIEAVNLQMRAQFYDPIIIPLSSGPKTKPRACNLGLWAAKGDYIVIYDAEDQPEPDQLEKAVATFERVDDEVACLQARLRYYNARQNILTRLFSLEYSLLFNFLLPGLAWLKMPLPLGGTSNFFKTEILKSVGGWDPYNVTEDADLGMRLGALGYRSAMLSSYTHEQATATFAAWTMQRSRWIKGFIQTWLVHSRHLAHFPAGGCRQHAAIPGEPPDTVTEPRPAQNRYKLKRPAIRRCLNIITRRLNGNETAPPRPRPRYDTVRYAASVHLVVGAVLWAVYLNPIFGLLYLLELSGYMPFSIMIFPGPIGMIAFYVFAFSTSLQIMLMGLTPMKTGQWRLALVAPLAPLYWSLQAVAGAIALIQIFRNPYHWEKTVHFEGGVENTLCLH